MAAGHSVLLATHLSGDLNVYDERVGWLGNVLLHFQDDICDGALGGISRCGSSFCHTNTVINLSDATYPWEPGGWNTSGTHTVMTHSSIKVFTLCMSTNLHPSDIPTETYTGQIGAGDISTRNDFLWLVEGSDAPALLEEWVKEVSRLTDAKTRHSIEEGLLRTITIRTSYLPEIRDILQSSSYWSTTHDLSRSLLYDTGPWDDTNRDSVIEQVYEASGIPPQHTVRT